MADKRVAQIARHLNFPQGMLAGQVAIITGSGQGIGAETARLFANEGGKVVVSDIDGGESNKVLRASIDRLTSLSPLAKAQEVADKINQSGGSAISVAGDILNDSYLKFLIKKATEFGNGKIHIIVNNAGYTWDGVIHKVDLSAFSMSLHHVGDWETSGGSIARRKE
jgi:3-oxoacyl-[acyl-carrier protein] reductase